MDPAAATRLPVEDGREDVPTQATPALSPDDRRAVRDALADLQAARTRVERDAARVLEDTRTKLVVELLPVLDNLDRSIAAGGDPAVIAGVEQVRAQLAGVLRGYGLERFDAIGQRFDPRQHDALGVAPVSDPARDGTVVEQWEPGYRAGAKLLRPARVVVGRLRRLM
jgi:molecular chaperone GrpE (heat shock protein)